jgi:hypothetical protein
MWPFKKKNQPTPAPEHRQLPGNQREAPVSDRFKTFKNWGVIFTVLLPGVAVIVANYLVFPNAYWIATIMVVVAIDIAGLFTIGNERSERLGEKRIR